MNTPTIRIGHGFDLHQLVEDRKLILGGVEIPHHLGLLGHSDADCLMHALADAMLGALALPDIGHHFPDTDPSNLGIDSSIILSKVVSMIQEKGYFPGNVDLTIIAQRPKLEDYLPAIRTNLSSILGIGKNCIGLKATTHEHIGSLGREEGIATHAVCLLFKK
ncbi:MAG: 2-C-methyl-D-erythritol 2,4-cyclodiphosphate synthase [Opitutae bacterium]|nr:2-C-methyl-D-erythritol 2,4-cyclodiphosphate synthase [Opitutae bacterium]